MLAIARDMEALCPRALLLNYTNPESRICLVVSRYTRITAVGLCHGIFMGMGTISHITGVPIADLDVQAAGLNHFLWMTAAHRRSTGEDLYPLVRQRLATLPADYLPLSVSLCKRFGLFPFPSDDHVGEYLGFAWPACLHHGYDFDAADRHNREAWAHIERMVAGEAPIDEYAQRTSGESAFDMVAAMLTGEPFRAPAVNIPNRGCITNLPADAVVEVPALVDADGIHGLCMGSLPELIAALCRTQIAIQSLVVEAAVAGCRDTALQALLLDPVVTDMAAAEACLDELLALQADYLPQFNHSTPRSVS
jgi:alpha-galactosidase